MHHHTDTLNVSGRTPARLLLVAPMLVLTADVLFFDSRIGLSLPVFAVLVFAAAAWIRNATHLARPAALLAVSVLPAVEWLQPLSVAFLVLGLVGSLAWLRAGSGDLASAAMSLLREFPFRAGIDLRHAARTSPPRIGPLGDAWLLPVGGGLVLGILLLAANPVLADLAVEMVGWLGDPVTVLKRLTFWSVAGWSIWGLLAWRHRKAANIAPRRFDSLGPSRILNGVAVTNALALFNAALAVQIGLDGAYLWGGAALPEGMTYAEYAQRGAYPLLATAMLAGLFAIVARPFTDGQPLLCGVLLLWLAQNVLLCASALWRLDLYVAAFGLTYLRVRAGIWMALVAVGLGLVAWQVLRARSNGWLLRRGVAVGLATLYGCAFVNFAALIAAHNIGDADTPLDRHYLCELGPLAAGPILEAGLPAGCALAGPAVHGWRDWSFRAWRVRAKVPALTTEGDVR